MRRRPIYVWFALGHLANDWPIAALWLIVPAAGVALGLSPSEIGLLFTIFSIGGAMAYLPAGVLADHVSNRGRLLVVTFWWVACGYVLAAAAPGLWSLALLLAIGGMGNAAWHPIATGVLARDSADRRAQALGIHAIGGSMAEVLAPLSVGFLLVYVDWRDALMISVLPTVAVGLCFIWVARAIPKVERKSVSRQGMVEFLNIWRRGNGIRILVMICAYNISLFALLSMIPLYLASEHGLAPATIGIIFSGLLLTGALAQPWVGKISDTAGRRPVLSLGNLTAGLACALLILGLPFWGMIAALALGIAALDAIRAVVLATAVDHTDHSESTTLGLAFVLMDGIGAVGAVLAGLAAEWSWSWMFGFAAAASLSAAALSYVTVGLRKPETESAANPQA